ncbi:hypothetical protein ID866_5559 [Astraeus odoratus]|nr:hypothetical protein ID866_5559 [Astraeus odoratus]
MSVAGSVALYFALTFSAFLVLKACKKWSLRNRLPLPPGPEGLPLIGNILELNVAEPWLSYEEWGKHYGDIVYVNLLGKDIVILNSEKVAHELLEQRSSIYSDRPTLSINKFFGVDFSTGVLPYGSQWRLHRKMFYHAFNKDATVAYRTIQMQKIHQLLQKLLDSPQNYAEHCDATSAAIIMAIAYDYNVISKNDPFVSKVVQFIDLLNQAITPERAALLNVIPLMSYLPSWFPGGEYKQSARTCRNLARDVLNDPVNYVQKCIGAGTAGKSLTCCTFLMFIAAMFLYPDVQTKAQEEIDRVVGTSRLPDFRDRPNLPYVDALLLECFRWHPVLPLGLPRVTTTSDVFNGMYIPKGAMILANLWAIARDEMRFPEPTVFKPERYLTTCGKLVKEATFQWYGFGRRSCPGHHVGSQSAWAMIVSVLATMRIEKAKDDFGNEIDVDIEFTTGISVCVFIRSVKFRRTREPDGL